MTEKDWYSKLKTSLRVLYEIEYEKLAFQKLWGIQLLILVKPEHHKKITHLQFSQVRTGIGNALGEWPLARAIGETYNQFVLLKKSFHICRKSFLRSALYEIFVLL